MKIKIQHGQLLQKLNLTAYRVTTNSDLTEGRGRQVIIGFFKKLTDAENAAKGRGVFGSNADVESKLVDVIVPLKGTVEDWKNAFVIDSEQAHKYYHDWIDPEDIRKRALSKLTNEEIDLLGIKR